MSKEERSGSKKAVTPRRKVKGDSPDKFFAKKKPSRDEAFEDKRTPSRRERRPVRKPIESNEPKEAMPLNKFIAHSGVCSRREAADLVKEGKVKVNGKVMLEPGYKVQYKDEVTYNGKKLSSQKDLVYVLLNKPKNVITTTSDPRGRKTVLDLISGVKADRVYPVGRLDRNTTGLLLLTNDGDLAQKLSHPKYNIKKIYQVTLDKPVTAAHFDSILSGLVLEDGKIKADALSYLNDKNEIGIEIHSGRNRIVRRIFEHLGYNVEKLDRVMYAGLTKKNIPRGKWRVLQGKEIIHLKHFKQ